MSNNTETNDKKDKFDELVDQIAGLTAEAETAEADDAQVNDSTVLDAQEDLNSPDSDDDGFEGANLVSLFDEEGNEYEFELLDYVDYNDKLYAVMIPSELTDSEDDQIAVIMETYFEGNEPNFIFVDDEELAQKVLDAYSAESGD